jgi:CDP-diacylglycerol--glycerol-3-phosphate 3-phosphatidyltransferase
MTIKSKKWLNLPNTVSLIRVALIPILVLMLIEIKVIPHPDRNAFWSYITATLFALLALTDTLDGYLARKYQQVTAFGKLIDPVADKLLFTAALVMLIPLERIPAWMVVVLLGRDLAVTGLRLVAASEGREIPVSGFGKSKTTFTAIATTALMAHHHPWNLFSMHLLGMLVLWIALILSVGSGIDYSRQFYRVMTQGEKK